MKIKSITALFTLHLTCALLMLPAHAADTLQSQTVEIEHRLNATPAHAWKMLGRFCSLAQWQSVVASCDVTERSNGVVRVVVMRDNTAFVEHLDSFSDSTRKFSYSMVSGPINVQNYRASFSIRKNSNPNESTLRIEATFDAPVQLGIEIHQQLSELFSNGMRGIDQIIAKSISASRAEKASAISSQPIP